MFELPKSYFLVFLESILVASSYFHQWEATSLNWLIIHTLMSKIRFMRNPFKKSTDPYAHRVADRGGGFKPPRIAISNKLKIVIGVVIFGIIIVFMFESVVVVEAGHRGVVLYVGAVENRVLGEGIHFIIPFAEQVVQMEVRTLKFEANATAASNDLQEVQTTIALNYHIDPNSTNIIYQQLGVDYADRLIAPTIQEAVKANVAKFDAEELITKRAEAKA